MKTINSKYHAPTYRRGAKYSATDEDGNRVMVSPDNGLGSIDNQKLAVMKLCRKMGWTGKLIFGHTKSGLVWVWLPHDLLLASRGRVSGDVLVVPNADGKVQGMSV